MQERVDDRSFRDLISDLVRDVTGLVRREIDLARAEVSEKTSQVTGGVIYLAVGGVLTFAGFIVLVNALVIELAERMSPALAALLVGIGVLILGAILLFSGVGKVRSTELTPTRTLDSLNRDKTMLEEKV